MQWDKPSSIDPNFKVLLFAGLLESSDTQEHSVITVLEEKNPSKAAQTLELALRFHITE